MNSLYWVGSRESDIKNTGNLFNGSICLYGENDTCLFMQKGQRIDNNQASPERDRFILDSVKEILKRNPNANFYFYDPSWVYEIKGLSDYKHAFICVNNEDSYRLFNDKISFYNMLKAHVPMIYTVTISNDGDLFEKCKNYFDSKTKAFVIQRAVSNGGNGTFVLNAHNKERIYKKLNNHERYLVSKYIKNSIPVNIHYLITEDDLIKLPGSVQLIRKEDDKLRYKGADYDNYSLIDIESRKLFEDYARKVCIIARKHGYRGICGIDGIITNDKNVFINEFNGRFQASTPVLNLCLKENGLPSVQELNLSIFQKKTISCTELIDSLNVPYSMYIYSNIGNQLFGNHILKNLNKEPYVVNIDKDGYKNGICVDKGIYMFRVMIRENISSISPEGCVLLHENVVEPDVRIYKKVLDGDRLAVKITLMTLGVNIEDETEKHLLRNGGIRPGNNNAIDMNLLNMIVNAPRDIKFISLSPYTLQLDKDNVLKLYYYNKFIAETKIYPLDPLGQKVTSRGVPYGTVAYLSTDRLRVHMTNECVYKHNNNACKFCNIVPCKDAIEIEDLREVINDYVANSPSVHHFLVGGQSMNQHDGMERITEICKMIRSVTSDKHIYVMALPYTKEAINDLVNAGMNELGCNIEIFDEALAKKYMPGKGSIPRTVYFDILSYAKHLLPENGSVRTMLIYGLEPQKTFLLGIKKLAQLGIQPIISIFRPLPHTEMEKMMAPPLIDVYNLYCRAEKICTQYSMHLGPSCIYCQNNTLSMPENTEELNL